MSLKNKLTIAIVLTIAATSAHFALAQTTTGLSQSDLQGVDAKIAVLNAAKSASQGKDTQAVIDARKMAMQACADTGRIAYADTNNPVAKQTLSGGAIISTLWTGSDTCTFGEWKSATGGTDLMTQAPYNIRTDLVVASTNNSISGMWGSIVASNAVFSNGAQANDSALDTIISWVKVLDPLSWFLAGIFNVINSFLLFVVSLSGEIINYAASQSLGWTFPSFVDVGWRILLDFMNMFFILALIIMSLATILRRPDNYNARKLILNLILMALLINFSKVIAMVLIDASNMVMRVFSSHWIGYQQYWSTLGTASFVLSSVNPLKQFAGEITRIFTMLLITASYGAIAVLLLLRYIGLSVLVMLSPVAYALYILPATSSLAKQWWQYFTKYLIWGPAAFFFLYLGQIFVQKGSSMTGDTTFDALYIAIFFWMALFVCKKAGMLGSGAILKAADGFWMGGGKMLSKYVMRGGPVANAGSLGAYGLKKTSWGQDHVEGIDKFNNKYFGAWRRGAQRVESVPGIAKKGMHKVDERYQEGVKSNERAALRRMGLGGKGKDDWAEYEAEEVRELLEHPDKLKRNQIADMTNNVSLDALHGAMQVLADKDSPINANPALKEELRQGIFKRLGGSGPVPDDVLEPTIDGSITKTSGGKFQFQIPLANNKTATRTLNVGSHDEAFEKSLMTDDQRKEYELQQRKLQAGMLSPEEAATATVRGMALEGIGSRGDIENSVISPSGQRVIMNNKVASELGISTDADLTNHDEIMQLAQVLRKEGANDADVARVVNVASQGGSVALQKGSYATLRDLLPREALEEGRQVLNQRRAESKQHERSHGFYNYIERQNQGDYQKIVAAVAADPAFKGLEQKMRSNEGYKNVPQTRIVEEVLARTSTRDQLSQSTKTSVNTILDTHRPEFIQKTKEILDQSKLIERDHKLRERIIERVGAPAATVTLGNGSFEQVREAAHEVRGAAGELSRATTGVTNAATKISEATSELKSATAFRQMADTVNDQQLRKAAGQITTGAETGARKLEQAAQIQQQSATQGAKDLQKAADAIRRISKAPSPRAVPIPKPKAPLPRILPNNQDLNENNQINQQKP
ncbi:MAG TPA: hypothetical protein VFX17_04475 [Patescibacteria group bacterium]|nr:hypothetical protein [Patescibacteria group bacterium]